MMNRGEAAQTACLMQGMADKLGLDAAVNALERERLGGMVTTCHACTRADDCILWMVDHSGGAETAPDYCLNAEVLGVMRTCGAA